MAAFGESCRRRGHAVVSLTDTQPGPTPDSRRKKMTQRSKVSSTCGRGAMFRLALHHRPAAIRSMAASSSDVICHPSASVFRCTCSGEFAPAIMLATQLRDNSQPKASCSMVRPRSAQNTASCSTTAMFFSPMNRAEKRCSDVAFPVALAAPCDTCRSVVRWPRENKERAPSHGARSRARGLIRSRAIADCTRLAPPQRAQALAHARPRLSRRAAGQKDWNTP